MSTCAVDSDQILIKEQGCTKVSTDLCKSGYMARSENVEFPLNAIDVCCRCKEGEACPYCINEVSCTEDELAEFVTDDEQCFEIEPEPEPEPDSEPEPEPEPKPAPKPKPKPKPKESFNTLLILTIAVVALLVILIITYQ